jgi:hypothetical protein
LSPYYPVIQAHDALLGPPESQDDVAEAFTDPEELRAWAKSNRSLYNNYLRWSSIIDNLELNSLLGPRQVSQLQAHYRFLSVFTHATGTGYKIVNQQQGALSRRGKSDHMLGELVLLYVCSLAVCELRAFIEFVDARSGLNLEGRHRLEDTAQHLASTASYLWFPRIGEPTDLDRFDEANRRAFDSALGRPRLTGVLLPEQIPPDEVGYYRDPLKRLVRLHQGESEMTTGFFYRPLW